MGLQDFFWKLKLINQLAAKVQYGNREEHEGKEDY